MSALQGDLDVLIAKKKSALVKMRDELSDLFLTPKTDTEAGTCGFVDSSQPSDIAGIELTFSEYFNQVWPRLFLPVAPLLRPCRLFGLGEGLACVVWRHAGC